MKEIPLTRGQTAIVCDCCYDKIKDYKWYAVWERTKQQFVAARRSSNKERALGASDKTYMHIVVNETPRGFETDHKDNNSLNNQCSNLRTATHVENNHNRTKQVNNTSGYKGVTWNKQCSKWQAQIQANGKQIHVGLFMELEGAARAYDDAARRLHGAFANTNFPTVNVEAGF